MKKWIVCGIILFLCANGFAVNKVVVDNLSWQIVETEHFLVYYYPQAIEVLPKVINFLEEAYDQVCFNFDYKPPEKTPFFFYLTHNQFEQNNIVDIGEGTGGVTEAFKYRFLVPYTGSEKEFKHVITHEFTHVIQYNQLLNGFWKSARILKTSLLNPLWIMEGLAEYESGHLDSTVREMYLRDAATTNRLIPLAQLHNFSHLRPHQIVLAYKESESAIRFIEEEYGKNKIQLLLKELRSKMDAYSVLVSLLGIDLFVFDKKWQEYLQDKYNIETVDLKEPEFYGKQITRSVSDIYEFNTNPIWGPDGKIIFFLSDRNGYNEIYQTDIYGKKWNLLVGLKNRDQLDSIQQRQNMSSISCSPDGKQIVFVGKKNQHNYLYFYDISKQKLRKVQFKELNTLSSPSFSPDGKQVVFIGMKKGINDLYLYSIDNNKLIPLNSDNRDECTPSFSPDGKQIVFSAEEQQEYDIYILNIQTKIITKMTDITGDELFPSFSPDGENIIFVSDQDGIYNLYLINNKGEKLSQITNVIGGIFSPKFSPDGKNVLFASFRRGETQIYHTEISGLEKTQPRISQNIVSNNDILKSQKIPMITAGNKYKLNFSTDLFFPLFFYSSYEGLYFYTYWQASEMLGNHQIVADIYYTDRNGNLNYDITYTYLRWRPQFIFSTQGNTFYYRSSLFPSDIRREEQGYSFIIKYPIDNSYRIEYLIGHLQAKENISSDNEIYSDKITIEGVTFILDTIGTKYLLTPLSGEQLSIGYRAARKIFSGRKERIDYFFSFDKFFPILFKHDLHWSLYFANSSGIDAKPIYLDIRGFEPLPSGLNVIANRLEYRFPIYSQLNYHMWYMLPDFFFKYFGGIIFSDMGYTYSNSTQLLHNPNPFYSAGIGLRFYAFMMQTYPMTIGIDIAHRINSDFSKGYFIFTLGFQ